MSARVSVEGARGCGYRKEGGLYLVSGQLSEPCPLLPFETSVCSTCGEGIKPARGFTWVDGEKFIPPTLHGTPDHCAVCPLAPSYGLVTYDEEQDGFIVSGMPGVHTAEKADELAATPQSRIGRCGLIWVGEQHYPTPQAFMTEAMRMGVSRRITAVPREFVIGETWVLLGHRKAIEKACSECGDSPEQHFPVTGGSMTTEHGVEIGLAGATAILPPDTECPVCEGTGYEHRPGIITAFKPTAIEYVVKPEEEDDEEFLEGLEKRGITPVKVVKDTDQQAMEV